MSADDEQVWRFTVNFQKYLTDRENCAPACGRPRHHFHNLTTGMFLNVLRNYLLAFVSISDTSGAIIPTFPDSIKTVFPKQRSTEH